MPPTAIDAGNAGTSVICWPPSSSTFPIGLTIVNCTGSDPLGNYNGASFTVRSLRRHGRADLRRRSPISNSRGSRRGRRDGDPYATDGERPDQRRLHGEVHAVVRDQAFRRQAHGDVRTASDASSNQVDRDVRRRRDAQAGAPIGSPCLATADRASGTCVDRDPLQHDRFVVRPVPGLQRDGRPRHLRAPTTGGSCDDGDACTQTDTCQLGTCTGGNPVTCTASDQCHVAGTCAPATGVCSNPSQANGTACNDGNACTQTDTCQAGVCTGANPVTCAASDQCHAAGSCDTTTGACSNPAAPDGTACNDDNACTTADVCAAGACGGGAATSCDDQNPCTVDACSPGRRPAPGPARQRRRRLLRRGGERACDSAEVCTGTSASCPASADKAAPTLAAGANQTVVGNCSGGAVVFAVPPLANASCESGTSVTCKWTSSGSAGTCAKSGTGASLPGNRAGVYNISCAAKDASGNASPAITFTVTVLQPLTIKIQPPLSGDNDTADNIVKLGSPVPNKVSLYAWHSSNVTKMVCGDRDARHDLRLERRLQERPHGRHLHRRPGHGRRQRSSTARPIVSSTSRRRWPVGDGQRLGLLSREHQRGVQVGAERRRRHRTRSRSTSSRRHGP